jgi:hypothetical protein
VSLNTVTLTSNEKSGDPELITRDFVSVKSKLYTKKLPRYPRASSLYKDCMRQLVLINKCKIEEKEYVKFSNTVVFDIGNSVHFWAQNTKSFISDDLRSGFWKCRSCNYMTPFTKKVQEKCPTCGANPKAFEYTEYSLKMEKPLFVTGHPDMFVEKPENNFRVLELKTIDTVGFDKLKAPLIEHLWQIQTYMWGIGKDRLAKNISFDPKYGYIMYISKGFKMKTSPVKTFLVKHDKVILRDIFNKLTEFKKGYSDNVLPPRVASCYDSGYSTYLAKNCPVLNFCKMQNNA